MANRSLTQLGLIGVLLLFSRCSSSPTQGNDGSIAPIGPPGKPVIVFVPGYKGTRLVDAAGGGTVWISASEALFGSRSLRVGVVGVGLPAALNLKPGRVLDRISIVPGIYGVDIYGSLLERLGSVKGADVLALPYDWRLDPFETVKTLDEIIERLLASGPREITLIGHSMGGMIVSYYLRYGGAPPETATENWAGARRVSRVVLAGVPFLGSMLTMRNLEYGDRLGRNSALLDESTLATFPAIYHLLPRAEADLLLSSRQERVSGVIGTPSLWREQGWGLLKPPVPGGSEVARFAYTSYWLERSRLFSERLNGPLVVPPDRKRELLYLSSRTRSTLAHGVWLKTSVPTAANVIFDDADRRKRVPETPAKSFQEPGDGVVTAISAKLPSAFEKAFAVKLVESSAEHLELVGEKEGQDAILDFINAKRQE